MVIISMLKVSIYPNVTKKDSINLHKLAEQQKNQRVIKTENTISKQTHDEKINRKFITNN